MVTENKDDSCVSFWGIGIQTVASLECDSAVIIGFTYKCIGEAF